MADITTKQIGCIKGIINTLGIDGPDMVSGFTLGRTEHVSAMTKEEGILMIRHLKSLDPKEVDAQRMRNKIIGMAYERAGLPPNATKEQKQEVVLRLDKWCVQYGYLHKKLNQMKYDELPKLVTQFGYVMADWFKCF